MALNDAICFWDIHPRAISKRNLLYCIATLPIIIQTLLPHPPKANILMRCEQYFGQTKQQPRTYCMANIMYKSDNHPLHHIFNQPFPKWYTKSGQGLKVFYTYFVTNSHDVYFTKIPYIGHWHAMGYHYGVEIFSYEITIIMLNWLYIII